MTFSLGSLAFMEALSLAMSGTANAALASASKRSPEGQRQERGLPKM